MHFSSHNTTQHTTAADTKRERKTSTERDRERKREEGRERGALCVYRDQTRCTFSFDRPEAIMSLAQWPGPAALCPSAGEVNIFKGFFGSMTFIYPPAFPAFPAGPPPCSAAYIFTTW